MSSRPGPQGLSTNFPGEFRGLGVSSTEALSPSTEPTPLSTGTLCNLWIISPPTGGVLGWAHGAGPRADLRPARGRDDPRTVGRPACRRACRAWPGTPRPPTGRTSPSTPARRSHRRSRRPSARWRCACPSRSSWVHRCCSTRGGGGCSPGTSSWTGRCSSCTPTRSALLGHEPSRYLARSLGAARDPGAGRHDEQLPAALKLVSTAAAVKASRPAPAPVGQRAVAGLGRGARLGRHGLDSRDGLDLDELPRPAQDRNGEECARSRDHACL